MYCSNCGAEVKGNFCSNCGAKIIVNVQQTPPSANQDTASAKAPPKEKAVPTILVRSESCMPVLESKRNRFFRIRGVTLGVDALLTYAIFPLLFSYWTSDLYGSALSDAHFFMSIVILALSAVLILQIALLLWHIKVIGNFIAQYKLYSSTEFLIVEADKITGSTTKWSLKLTYDQIQNVTSFSGESSRTLTSLGFSNSILKIKDVAGNQFVFYSFSNCTELKTAIERGIAEKHND